jgi:phage-related protein
MASLAVSTPTVQTLLPEYFLLLPARRGQIGRAPSMRLTGVGSGVMEIAERYATDAYGLVYTVPLGKSIYVLHVFQKKSKSRVATPKKDVDLI